MTVVCSIVNRPPVSMVWSGLAAVAGQPMVQITELHIGLALH